MSGLCFAELVENWLPHATWETFKLQIAVWPVDEISDVGASYNWSIIQTSFRMSLWSVLSKETELSVDPICIDLTHLCLSGAIGIFMSIARGIWNVSA